MIPPTPSLSIIALLCAATASSACVLAPWSSPRVRDATVDTSPDTPDTPDGAVDVGTDLGTDAAPPDLGIDAPPADCGEAGVSCGAACVNLGTDDNNCGRCGSRCDVRANGRETCVAAACSLACAPGFGDCDRSAANGCEVLFGTDARNCGTCGNACAAGMNATATCAAGRCGLRCDDGFADCDGNATNGCEVDTRTSIANCGACGTRCIYANAGASCAAGSCVMGTCNPGFADCVVDPAGCETSLGTTANCGMCGSACPAGRVCSGSTCTVDCSTGLTRCGSGALESCVSLASDNANCGVCGMSCPATPAHGHAGCMRSACALTCDVNYVDVDGDLENGCEVDLRTDADNCGRRGNACPALQTCCAGTCIDLQTSPANCGACGVACSAPLACRGAACVLSQQSCPVSSERGCGVVSLGGGTFAMGDVSAGARVVAGPVQSVITVAPFAMDAYEVTLARFRRFWAAGAPPPTGAVTYPNGAMITMPGAVAEPINNGAGSCHWQRIREVTGLNLDLHPINCVDWPTALAFCVWDGGRLPTEAEWEWAARGRLAGADAGVAGAGPRYPWGNDDPMGTVGGACDHAQWHDCLGEDLVATRVVGRFDPTGDLYDLAGNVSEWTADRFALYTDTSCWGGAARVSPLCQAPSTSITHSSRGGSYGANLVADLRAASRPDYTATFQDSNLGFRCVR